MPRSPQGHPVLIQAGSSGPGQALASRIADVVFTAQNDLAEAQAFYRGVKAQVAGFGRPADEVLVMPGVFPVIGRTEAEAQEIFAELNRNIDTAQAFTVLSERLGADMSVHPLDEPVPVLPETEHLKSRAALLIEMARRDKLTLRQLYHRVAAARGHLLLIGTGAEIADVLEAWFRAGAADGFNVMPPFFPGQFDAFVAEVVPLLQERGLFRADYTGTTLREHLGLKRPDRAAENWSIVVFLDRISTSNQGVRSRVWRSAVNRQHWRFPTPQRGDIFRSDDTSAAAIRNSETRALAGPRDGRRSRAPVRGLRPDHPQGSQ